ncbi:MAG: flavodoxin-dependent (E)-4-hydroxy-3-methylbut-2-enyl-diphosphate synthase, partial [Oscillospiraceae bacterium]|nr:flavodoxin-dependent (E)-4-hydroxy-3-methylbut-2-enyl-diphosphate synthase [Oscillospiraceae bacterium]
ILAKYGHVCSQALVESAKKHIDILNECDFDDIVVSLKASDVNMTIDSYRLMSERYDYPLHLGVTEAGTFLSGAVKSAIGIGALLKDGIGDTIRVSLTDDPVQEIRVAKEILKALELRSFGAKLVSCPTCARTNIGLIPLAKKVEEYLQAVDKNITVAVMGCVVHGPGEAREADVGIAGGDHCAILFKKGEVVRKLEESEILTELFKEIDVLSE